MRKVIERYRVSVFGRLEGRELGSVDVSHTFASKSKAERFAKAIAKALEVSGFKRDGFNGPDAWVLVYALADGFRQNYTDFCYLSFDPGGVESKRHAIPVGCYGSEDVEIDRERARMRADGWRWNRALGTWQLRGSRTDENETIDLGNNESMSRGVYPTANGEFLALDFSRSKTFKTERGARAWLSRSAEVAS